jgi:hypothetical protein
MQQYSSMISRNLFALYDNMANCIIVEQVKHPGGLKSLQTTKSDWPNFVYNIEDNFFNNEDLATSICMEMADKKMPSLLIDCNAVCDMDAARKKNFYVIEQWSLMWLHTKEMITTIGWGG